MRRALYVSVAVTAEPDSGYRISAQKKFVDYIMRAAYPYIKGHNVILGGFVEEKQAREIAGRLAREKIAYDGWVELCKAPEDSRPRLCQWDTHLRHQQKSKRVGGGGQVRRPSVEELRELLKCECEPKCCH